MLDAPVQPTGDSNGGLIGGQARGGQWVRGDGHWEGSLLQFPEEGATPGPVGKPQAHREAEGAGGCGQEALLWFPQEGTPGEQA